MRNGARRSSPRDDRWTSRRLWRAASPRARFPRMITNRITRRRSAARLSSVSVLALVLVVNVAESQPARGGRPALATAVRAFVQIDTPTVVLTHVRVIDGTGAPARPDQTIVIRDGQIAAVGTGA